MIQFRPPSLSKAYDEFVSLDPAFEQLPLLADDATDEQREQHNVALDEYRAKLRVAHQTGDWTGMLAPGKTLTDATKFTLLPVDSNIWRELVDRATQREGTPGRIGGAQLRGVLVRLAVKAVSGFPIKIERAVDPDWGYEMAQSDVIDVLDKEHPGIVGELGTHITQRLRGADPLSPKG